MYFSNLMEENAFWQSQITQVIKENAKIYLESQISGTLYFFGKSLACVFPHIFLCFFFLGGAVWGLHCCAQAFSSCGERGLLLVAVHRLLIVVASLVAEHRL